jgi:hypothetical protein
MMIVLGLLAIGASVSMAIRMYWKGKAEYWKLTGKGDRY